MLSIMKNSAGMHKRSQWQCKSNCINGSGLDIPKGRIPLPYKNRLCIGPPWTIWKRKTEKEPHETKEETEKMRKTWRKVRATAGKRVCWHCFVKAL
jgi:hypothetical protein